MEGIQSPSVLSCVKIIKDFESVGEESLLNKSVKS